jgi:Cu+-exporting ATPase
MGVNYATALAQANVGFVIGTGTDIAVDASGVTLIKCGPMCIITAIAISRAKMRNVRRNLISAFGENVLGISVAMGVSYPFIRILLSLLRLWASAR